MPGDGVEDACKPHVARLVEQLGVAGVAQIARHEVVDPPVDGREFRLEAPDIGFPTPRHAPVDGQVAQHLAKLPAVGALRPGAGVGQPAGDHRQRHAQAVRVGIEQRTFVEPGVAEGAHVPADLAGVGRLQAIDHAIHAHLRHGFGDRPRQRRDGVRPALAQILLRPEVEGLRVQAAELRPVVVARHAGGRGQRRHRPRLEQDHRAAGNGPFHILRAAKQRFQFATQAHQLGDLFFVDGLRAASRRIDGDFVRAARNRGRHHGLVAQGYLLDAPVRLGGDDGVGIDAAGHQRLAQPPRGVDDHLVRRAGDGVDRKEHARRIGRRHGLHDDGQAHLRRVDSLPVAVGHGARRPQAAPAALDRIEQRGVARDVEVGVLLAGKAGVGQIFGRGGGAHGDRRCFAERGVGGKDRRRQFIRQRGGGKGLAKLCRGAFEAGCAGRIDGLPLCRDERGQAGRRHERAIGRGRHHEAVGHRQPGAHHRPQVGALAAGHLQGDLFRKLAGHALIDQTRCSHPGLSHLRSNDFSRFAGHGAAKAATTCSNDFSRFARHGAAEAATTRRWPIRPVLP